MLDSSPELVEALLACARACLLAFPTYFVSGICCLSPYTFVRVLLNLCRPIGGRSGLGCDPRDWKQWEPIAKVDSGAMCASAPCVVSSSLIVFFAFGC